MNLNKQILTKNACYIKGDPLTPKGIMVHSTGANNPNLSRYVGPDDGKLGTVSSNNWNQYAPGGSKVCVHAFIGKLKDGNIATYQTLPWNMRGWHSGSGIKGSANNTHIGFEICEDGLNDESYFKKVYQEAIELTAYLCNLYNLDPLKDGVIICHSEGYKRGIASNHSDVTHWFPKFGKTMDDFRQDVKTTIEEEDMTQDKFNEMMEVYLQQVAQKNPGSWSKNERDWAEDNGIIIGDSNGLKKYKSWCTREEMVIFLKRLYDEVLDK